MNIQRNLQIIQAEAPQYFIVLDTSVFLSTMESATLLVKIPGFSTVHELEFNLGEINSFNSYSFGLTTSETEDFTALPDGVYEVNLITCPDTGEFKIYHLRTTKIMCRLAKQWALYVNSCGLEDIKVLSELDRIEFLLKGGEAHAQLCNVTKATELYIKADELLRRIENDCQ